MKILHTADVHIKKKEHLSIIESLIRIAKREQVELIIIAGDLFDASANGRVLENALLPIWETFYGDILIVPGNHDCIYLRDRQKLASNVIVANKEPYSIAQIDNVYFVCVPYQKNISLKDIMIPDFEPSILIAHGTYNSNKESTYFPIAPEDVAGRYRYVALGHYHTWFDKWVDGTLIVNPGAPRQTRKSDKGARYVSIIDTETWMMERVVLPVSFVEYKTVNISIVDSQKDIIEKFLFAVKPLKEHSYCIVSLQIQGSIMFSKYSLIELIEQWKFFLEEHSVDVNKIEWNLDKIIQISPKLIYSSFAKLLVDKVADRSPEELADLAPFLFERLQHQNQQVLD